MLWFLNFLQDVDQRTGQDLNSSVNEMLYRGDTKEESLSRNPDRPPDHSSFVREEKALSGRGMTRMTSPEKWEIKQLIAAGVLEKSDYPGKVMSLSPLFLMYVATFCYNNWYIRTLFYC